MPKREYIYAKTGKYTPNGHRICHHLPLQGPTKFTQIGFLGLKVYHLATLHDCEAPEWIDIGIRERFLAGLPDGLFSHQKPKIFWKAFEWKILISFMTIV
jgi:hypothetical protein